jgi:hypothetical protein
MKKTIIVALSLLTGSVFAQTPEDALRMSWNVPSGSARNQAIGGAMGSLGGDISSVFVNPAGIGLYKTGELVITPGFRLINTKSDFRGTDADASRNRFVLGTSGVVWGYSERYGKWRSKAFSFAVTKTADFNSKIVYQGQNYQSSFSEAFAEEFANSGLPIDVRLYDAPLSLGTKLANYTYLIDTASINGTREVVGLPQLNALQNGTLALLDQRKEIFTKGGVTELAFAFAGNMDDQLYLGASIGIPIVNYERETTMRESDADGIPDNFFNYAEYKESYSSTGIGVNAKVGLIVKPSDNIRLGFGVHSPTLYGLKESTTGSIEADLENYFSPGKNVRFASADSIYTQFGVGIPEYKYDLISPWKFLGSISYVFSENEDTRMQKGFVTADVEYVTHRSSRFSAGDEFTDDAYFDAVNEATREIYKGTMNFRVGGELKFNTFMTRLGFAYYGNPYKDSELKARKMLISGGIGYRHRGMFVDLTYVHGMNKDVNFPYRLGDKPNTFAELNQTNSHALLTVGFKF